MDDDIDEEDGTRGGAIAGGRGGFGKVEEEEDEDEEDLLRIPVGACAGIYEGAIANRGSDIIGDGRGDIIGEDDVADLAEACEEA